VSFVLLFLGLPQAREIEAQGKLMDQKFNDRYLVGRRSPMSTSIPEEPEEKKPLLETNKSSSARRNIIPSVSNGASFEDTKKRPTEIRRNSEAVKEKVTNSEGGSSDISSIGEGPKKDWHNDMMASLDRKQEELKNVCERLAGLISQTTMGLPVMSMGMPLTSANGMIKKEYNEHERSAAPEMSESARKEKRRAAYRARKERKEKEEEIEKERKEVVASRIVELHGTVRAAERQRSKNQAKDGVVVKKHSLSAGGGVEVLFQVGQGKPVWMWVEEIWSPANLALYLPAWQKYCLKKQLPVNWMPLDANRHGAREDSAHKKSAPTGMESNMNDISDTESEAEPAECYGHKLDDRGAVYMELKWKDTGDQSRGEVRAVMSKAYEKKKLGPTWMEYCNSKGITDDRFRIEGRSVVKLIRDHDWDKETGRPLATIEWSHGETTTAVVYRAFEKKGDANGFEAAWIAYCGSIQVQDEAFLKGYVDKNKKAAAGKKRRRRN
jgi:hypothetical protein